MVAWRILLDSRDDELWLLGLNEVRRVDNLVLSLASSLATERLLDYFSAQSGALA
jgi:hypothetical protein